MKKKNGFTLIELLAVIIILGILMIIAIPSVTKYISDSRKNSYVDTAKEIISGTRNKVNEGKLGMYDTNATYYIPVDYIKTENAQKSPYGDFVKDAAYVVVTYNGQGYSYYWISVDDAGQGVKEIVSYNKLDTDDIVSDIDPSEIESYVKTTVVGNRNTVKILDTERVEWITPVELVTNHVPEEGSSGNSAVVYPEGKTKDTVEIGDIVTIDTEEFYVVKHDGNDLVLLSHYNLNVGDNKKPGATKGIQDSEVKGRILSGGTSYGTIAFSSSNYWNGKVGDGNTYPGRYCSSDNNCAYVYDSNSNLHQYVEEYKTYLEEKGVTIKEARLLRVEEAFELGCNLSNRKCTLNLLKVTSFWLGSPSATSKIFIIGNDGYFFTDSFSIATNSGIRPVIVI